MRRNNRHEQILDLLKREKSISVGQLASLLDVSEVTIRKDLSLLESQQLLCRAYGCAILIDPFINDRHIEKENINAEQKKAIARVAAAMIADNDSIIIASGATMHYIAQEITPRGRLTIVAASAPVAEILARHEPVEIILLGGTPRHSSLSIVGNSAESLMRSFSCSKLFLGIDGVDLLFGFSTISMAEATLNAQMIRAAQRTIALGDSAKFRMRGLSKICDVEAVDQVITVSRAPAHFVEQSRNPGAEVTQA
jgi:DeoR family transcriptional regulator of aga operon